MPSNHIVEVGEERVHASVMTDYAVECWHVDFNRFVTFAAGLLPAGESVCLMWREMVD